MPTRNVVLTDHQSSLITQLVSSGRYQNASEVLREGIRLIERQEEECQIYLQALREAADAGLADIEAGRFRDFSTLKALRDHLTTLTNTALAGTPSDTGRRR